MNLRPYFSLLFLLCFLNVHAQKLFEKTYGIDDGLANVSIADIKQDWKGQLWFANYGSGVSVFNGKDFTQYDENDGLTNPMVRCLTFDENENLWAGTVGGGISIFINGRFIDFKDTIGGIDDNVYSLFTDREKNIWIGTKAGLFKYTKGRLEGISERYNLPDQPIQSIVQDNNGAIWLGFWDNGLYCLKESKTDQPSYEIQSFTVESGLISNNISSLEIDHNGNLLIGTFRGLQEATYDDLGLNFNINKTKDLPDAQVFDITHSKQFGLCVAFGTEGIYQWNQSQNTWLKLNLDNEGLIYHCFDDREGFFWLSLWQDKMVRVSSTFVKTHEIGTNITSSLSRDIAACGSKVLAAYPHKILAFENDTFSDITNNQIFEHPINQVICLNQSELFVNNSNGLFKQTSGIWKDISSYKEFINRPVTGISIDKDQNLWIALQDGPPMKYDGKSYSLIRSEDLEEKNKYELIETSENGSVWLSSRKTGLIRVNGSNVHIIKIENLPPGKISDLFSDQQNNLWFTSQGFGVGMVTPDLEIKLFGEEYGFPQDVRSILVDRNGFLWVGAKTGVFVLNTKLALANEIGYALHISTNEGLPDDQCLPNQIIEENNGNIWVATKRGIAEIDSKVALRNSAFIYPKIHIESVKMFFKDVDWRNKGFEMDKKTYLPKNLILKPDENQLSFVINAVSVQNQKNTFYRYRLNGLEVEFSPVSSGPLITYHDLRPGDYTLVIKPCDVQGICSDEETHFSFKILKPFYKTWWFYTLLFVFVNGTFVIIIRIRDKNLLRNQQLLEQRVAQRTLEIETQKRIIEENNRDITDSIKYAKRIQRAMVPSEKEIRKVFPDSFAMFLPKNIVSGDFFMINELVDGKVITVADCTGHGVPGAMMSMLGYGLFLEAIKDKTIETGDAVFNFVSRSIINQLKQHGNEGGSRDGMDASMFIYKKESNAFEFTGAHNSGYLIGDVQFEDETNVVKHNINGTILYELKANKQPLGINKQGGTSPFSSIKGVAAPGTKVYLMTDGYADQFGSILGQENNGTGKKFRIKRLREKIVEIQDLPMADQHKELHTTMSIWKGALEQVDDITLIGVKL